MSDMQLAFKRQNRILLIGTLLLIPFAIFLYAFLFYCFSYAPFLHIEVDNYWYSLLATCLFFALSCIFIFIRRVLMAKTNLLDNDLIAFVVFLLGTVIAVFLTDFILKGIAVVYWVKLLIALHFSFKKLSNEA